MPDRCGLQVGWLAHLPQCVHLVVGQSVPQIAGRLLVDREPIPLVQRQQRRLLMPDLPSVEERTHTDCTLQTQELTGKGTDSPSPGFLRSDEQYLPVVGLPSRLPQIS